MRELLKGTIAYKILSGEVRENRVAHSYLITIGDSDYLPFALNVFAKKLLNIENNADLCKKLDNGSLVDVLTFPQDNKKLNVEMASSILEDSSILPTMLNSKLYIINNFQDASAIVQNKLLKVLEEPPKNVHFLLGATTTSPILSTILSRVRHLNIPPFSDEMIYMALNREFGQRESNRLAASNSFGIYGIARKIATGELLELITSAKEIATCSQLSKVDKVATKYADFENKSALLGEVQKLFLESAVMAIKGDNHSNEIISTWNKNTLINAASIYEKAQEDLLFNAYFSALLYKTMVSVIKENDKWQKL